MSIIVETPFQNFTGLDGKPLTNGKVYIGQVGTDPTVEANQIPVFWDEELTDPAFQPLTTNAGYIVRTGTPARVYAATDYSMSVKNASGALVYYVQKTGNFGLVSLSALASSAGASLIGWIQSGFGAILRTVQDKLRESVTPYDFGAAGDGVADDSTAIQRATNTGKAVNFLSGTFRVSTPITYTGKVFWFSKGGAIIKSDGPVLNVTSGTGSRVSGLRLVNITAPWIINRDVSNWAAVPTIVQSNGPGYQPTSNDIDIYASLTPAQQAQDIGPSIKFEGNASDIVVSNLTGEFLSILMYDTQFSTVRDCNFRAGKNFAAGILFWNINQQRGDGNRAVDNTITYPSYSGITFARNYNGLCSGNSVDFAGESGVKTNQGVIAGVDSRCYRMQIVNNQTQFAYYDGFDLSSDYPHTGLVDSQHDISNNSTFGNRQTGFFADGQNNQFDGNLARACGQSGIQLTYSFSSISDNHVYDCNKSNTLTGVHQLAVLGDVNLICGNFIRQISASGNAIYANGQNYVANNHSPDGTFFFGVPGSITSTLIGNRDSVNLGLISFPQQIRQVADNLAGLTIATDTLNASRLSFRPRSVQIQVPVGDVAAEVTLGLSTTPNGALVGSAAQAGVLYPGWRIQTDNTIPGKAWVATYAPNTVVPSSYLPVGTVAMSLNEATNTLVFSVKYSTGVTKTGQISLT